MLSERDQARKTYKHTASEALGFGDPEAEVALFGENGP
jgi:hypothetical protein